METFPATESSERRIPPLIESEQRTALLLDYAACCPLRGEPDTWGATPSSISESLLDQSILINRFARRHVVPNTFADTDPSIVDYMERTSIKRFINRCIANDENYLRALSPNPFTEVDDDRSPRLKNIETLAKTGKASPAEILALQGIHRIGAIELASLTHPYNANIEYLDDMRHAVKQAVLVFGGEFYDEPEVHFSISDVINDTDLETINPQEYDRLPSADKMNQRDSLGAVKGLLMTRKRTIGQLPDGTIIRERTSFILTEESGILTDENLQLFADTPRCEHWGREAVHQMEGLDLQLLGMLERNEVKKVIPVASTTYAFNRERLEEINQSIENYTNTSPFALEGHAIHDKLRNLAAEQLYKAGQEGMLVNRAAYEDLDGMAFFKSNG